MATTFRVSIFEIMINVSRKSIKLCITGIFALGTSISFESCSLLNRGVSYSQEIFINLTAPEEGGVNFTQLTKESDIVQGPDYRLTTESIQNGSEIIRTEVLMWNTATFLSISPDGRNFTFLGNNNNSNNLYIRSTEGGASAVQRTFRSYVFDFAYSPDGKFLTFSDRVGVGTSENYNIYQIEVAKGNAVRQIAATDASELNPVYSNDAKALFYSRSSGSGYSLWSIDLESGLQTQYSEGFNPCFVPAKSSKELFVTRSAKNSQRTEIWKIDLEMGSETQVITDNRRSFSSPKVSPNGKYLLVSGATPKSNARPMNLDLYLFRTDGSGETQLTFHPGTDASAVWAPSGKEIYFISTRGSATNKYNVWRLNVEQFLN
jgi:Tol biopolymer transport system component